MKSTILLVLWSCGLKIATNSNNAFFVSITRSTFHTKTGCLRLSKMSAKAKPKEYAATTHNKCVNYFVLEKVVK